MLYWTLVLKKKGCLKYSLSSIYVIYEDYETQETDDDTKSQLVSWGPKKKLWKSNYGNYNAYIECTKVQNCVSMLHCVATKDLCPTVGLKWPVVIQLLLFHTVKQSEMITVTQKYRNIAYWELHGIEPNDPWSDMLTKTLFGMTKYVTLYYLMTNLRMRR